MPVIRENRRTNITREQFENFKIGTEVWVANSLGVYKRKFQGFSLPGEPAYSRHVNISGYRELISNCFAARNLAVEHCRNFLKSVEERLDRKIKEIKARLNRIETERKGNIPFSSSITG
jgi:hypothetical protein